MTESDFTSVAPRDPDGTEGFAFRRVRNGAATRFLAPAGTLLRFRSRAADTLEIHGIPADFFAAGDSVAVDWRGATVFRGGLRKWATRLGPGGGILADATFEGPWGVLSRLAMRQSWQSDPGGSGAATAAYTTRVILNQGAGATTHLSLPNAVAGVLSFAAAAAPDEIAAGTVTGLPAVFLPFDETREITCEQALERLLRCFPAVVSSVDYSKSVPTVSLSVPSAAADAPWTAGADASSIRRDYDARPCRGVVLEVESVGSRDGRETRSSSYFCAGDGVTAASTGPDILRAYIQLAGRETETEYATLEVEAEAVPSNLNDASWWKAKHPRLASVAATDIAITSGARDGAGSLPHITSCGPAELAAFGFAAEAENFTCRASVKHRLDSTGAASGDVVEEEENILLSLMFVTTNATAGTHRRRISRTATSAEALPDGGALAAAILAQRSAGLSSIRMDVALGPGDDLPKPGDAYGGLLLAEAEIDCAARTASCVFGRPEYLSPDDMRSLMTGFRARATTRHHTRRFDASGDSDPGGDIPAGGIMPLKSSEFCPGQKKSTAWNKTVSSLGHKVRIDPADIAFASSSSAAAQEVKLREVAVVVQEGGNAVAKKAQVLCGAAYGPAIPVGGGAPSNPSSADTLGSTDEGSESSNQSAWTAGGSAGLKLYVLTRVVYDERSGKTLYGFKRLLTFDSQGRLYSAGVESRYEIAAAVEATFSL